MAETAGHTTHVRARPSGRVQQLGSSPGQAVAGARAQAALRARDGSASLLAEVRRLHADAEVIVGLR